MVFAMIDNVGMFAERNYLSSLLKEKDDEEIEFLKFGNLDFIANRSKKTFHIKNYQSEVKNLLFTLSDRGFKASNSLHKFSDEKGLNFSDFTFTQILKTIENIESLTRISAKDFKFNSIEIAVNITTPLPPHQYLQNFATFKNREFDKMKVNGFWYGNKYIFTEYSIKIYDKTELLKRKDRININENILRFEIQYHKSRTIPVIQTLEDLKDREKLQKIFSEFIEVFKNVKYVGNEDFSNISARERELYFSGQNPRFWKIEKSLNTNTAKSKMKKFKKIQVEIAPQDLINFFIGELENKIEFLLEN